MCAIEIRHMLHYQFTELLPILHVGHVAFVLSF